MIAVLLLSTDPPPKKRKRLTREDTAGEVKGMILKFGLKPFS